MRIIRYQNPVGKVFYGAEQPFGGMFRIEGDIFSEYHVTNERAEIGSWGSRLCLSWEIMVPTAVAFFLALACRFPCWACWLMLTVGASGGMAMKWAGDNVHRLYGVTACAGAMAIGLKIFTVLWFKQVCN